MRNLKFECSFFLLFEVSSILFAQPQLRINSIEFENGRCKIVLSVSCAGLRRFDLTPIDFAIDENGFPVEGVTIDCPDSTQRYCKKIGLVTDLKFPLTGDTLMLFYRAAMKTFIEKMQPCDEVAYIKFGNPIRVKHAVTNDTVALKKAVDDCVNDAGNQGWDPPGAIILIPA